ncbi:hypothetical protein H4582DRAFT_1005898 [Lactarius indigo]|nr:hypothetical protein H4582DRAFT_1005898 [Lactarius indigo]
MALQMSAGQASLIIIVKCAGASNALPPGFSANRGCQGRRRPVAARTVDATSTGIGITLCRLYFEGLLGIRVEREGTREPSSCMASLRRSEKRAVP